MVTEDRFMEIEIKISRQEDMLDALNQVVYQQQKKIDNLEALCSTLAGHLKNTSDTGSTPNLDNERPPHY
jgi:SlyX protein